MRANRPLQPLPEFNEAGYEAVATCLDIGAAKLFDVLPPIVVKGFGRCMSGQSTRYDSATIDTVLERSPEIRQIHDLLYTEANIVAGLQRSLFSNVQAAKRPQDVMMGHLDAPEIAPDGISLLMPILGPKAIFAASCSQYRLGKSTFIGNLRPLPDYITEYGPGDILLLRQNVKSVNGDQVKRDAMYHCGAAGEDRLLLYLDFIGASLTIEPAREDQRKLLVS